MTALRSPARTTTVGHPPGPRLVGAAIVGAIGAIVLSIAIGNFVVGSRHDLPAAIASDARSLVATVPGITFVGLLHLVVAAALASGRSRVRTGARVATGLGAVAAGTVAVTTVVAHLGSAVSSLPTAVVLLTVAYAVSTILTAGEPAG